EAAGRRARQGCPASRRVSCEKVPEGYTAAPGEPDIRPHRRSKCVPHVPHSRKAARRACPDLLGRAATVPPGDETSPRQQAFLPQPTRSLLLPVGGGKRCSSPPPQGAVGYPALATEHLHHLGQRLLKRHVCPLRGRTSNLIRHPFQQIAIRVAGIEAQ